MRWWGWGDPGHGPILTGAALDFLNGEVGVAPDPRPPVALANVSLAASALDEGTLEALRAVVGSEAVRSDHAARVFHAGGKGYPDLVRMRAGEPEGAPDAVLLPSDREHVQRLLAACERSSLAVVPFGGGTSVVGGLAPLRGGHRGVVALEMQRMGRVLGIDRASLTVTVEAGARAAAVEAHLAQRGLTLGHFPQSFEYVSLGGCAATRSAGQASSGYGSIEKMVAGLRLCAPSGEIELPAYPASAAGPSMRQILVGSEGILGVITELSLRVRPAPRERCYEGVFFESFAAGIEALRALAQEHARPEIARLSNEQETRVSLALAAAGGGVKARAGEAYLRARGYGEGCLAILGYEGEPAEVHSRRRRAHALVRHLGALRVGRSPGEAWARSRYEAPYLRDELLTHGVMVETLETATQWSNLKALHDSVERAISETLAAWRTPGLVMCHVSHLYDTGASLYFTFLARQHDEQAIAQWRAVKEAASAAIVHGGGTITHHHAVGRDHAPWMVDEVGTSGRAALQSLKATLDPAGIMNPGKLIA
ncbi:MAG: FAD-binding oxidoreductase [Actinobacteria bacterium]|nr:MAG: FAD-binding oxidoreductase [Actinomycetota bacterium]